ncbi:hypothetical protein PbJCM13498_02810 [Prolixibacter bellariivorans]|uniref:Cyclic nucleotide-binding domain-containing protein n=1 Tax=Prolixibacter bellariivorans TaxID=314319 RepID=A0A5M4AUU2_9BACT|nr:Crp/Fnr family transcriptional regulator [Prolixibacter bellariivorans]GET31418.1 hypothetical protein PbJCM13498_02810 [Prolixibacter bellariivorans]
MDEFDNFRKSFKQKFESYAPMSPDSWQLIESLVEFQTVQKDEVLLHNGQVARNLHFICRGALIAYYTDDEGNSYNKNIFLENDFAGSTISLMKRTPSNFTLEALEDTILININYRKYRELIDQQTDLKDFYIAYLEKNWVMDKEPREISLVMETATERYIKLLQQHPDIDKRIPQRHLASHLGITPTQLSRIRKDLKKNS